jgi:hypothetical protein
MAAVVANLMGFSDGVTAAEARSLSVWLFVAVLPVAGLGVATAWRLAALTARDGTEPLV